MNVELLEQVKDSIRQSPEEFDMGTWDCGTSACIAGWICRLAGSPYTGEDFFAFGQNCYTEHAARFLEVPVSDAKRLFYASNWPQEVWQDSNPIITSSDAVRAIDWFMETYK